MVHSRISVREDSGLVSDVPISRLQVVHGIRRFTEADRPNISRLQTSSWLNKYDQADSPEHLAGPLQEANASSWRTAIFGEREFVLVAESEWDWEARDTPSGHGGDGSGAGSGSGSSIETSLSLCGFVAVLDKGDHAWVDNLHVHQSQHHQVTRHMLMAGAAQQMLELGYETARLTVLESNASARAFFAALGADEVGVRVIDFLGIPLRTCELEWRSLGELASVAAAQRERERQSLGGGVGGGGSVY
jgi:ribosomal protein S18 acetylase RimI-like enzyme